jgi:hypothetical protein
MSSFKINIQTGLVTFCLSFPSYRRGRRELYQSCLATRDLNLGFRVRLQSLKDVATKCLSSQLFHNPIIMSNSSTPNPLHRGSGLSLYANLLDPTSTTPGGSISKGPVVFKAAETPDEASVKKPQIDAGRCLLLEYL